MKSEEMRKRIIMALPYVLIALIATHFGQAWRMSESSEPDMRVMGFLEILPSAFSDILPSFHPFDLLIGVTLAAIMLFIVYSKRKNAKKYREGIEYGSARWGTKKDIAPFIDPEFSRNVILTQTEYLTMNNRPKNPAYARNKNVLVIGGSGAGKTRFWLKPSAPLRAA